MSTRSPLADRIASLKLLSDIHSEITSLRTHLSATPPEYVADVIEELRNVVSELESTSTAATPDEEGDDGPHLHSSASRMTAFFRERSNKPATIQEIADGIGANLEAIRSVLYKRNRGRFIQSGRAIGSIAGTWMAAITPVSEEDGDPNMFGL